jgi:hypothetical protein
MPPQKNSGNKGAKRESGTSMKNKRFVNDILSDLKNEEDMSDIYIARVSKKLGNGRLETEFYSKNDVTNQISHHVKHAVIPGRFRGKGKHSVWIDVGTVVALGDAGVGADLIIMAVLTRQQLKEMSKSMYIDERIMNADSTKTDEADDGFEFEDEQKPQNKLLEKEEIDDVDVDNI